MESLHEDAENVPEHTPDKIAPPFSTGHDRRGHTLNVPVSRLSTVGFGALRFYQSSSSFVCSISPLYHKAVCNFFQPRLAPLDAVHVMLISPVSPGSAESQHVHVDHLVFITTTPPEK